MVEAKMWAAALVKVAVLWLLSLTEAATANGLEASLTGSSLDKSLEKKDASKIENTLAGTKGETAPRNLLHLDEGEGEGGECFGGLKQTYWGSWDNFLTFHWKRRRQGNYLHEAPCLPVSNTSGRCGPDYGRCNTEYGANPDAIYCNTENGYCGNTKAHQYMQPQSYLPIYDYKMDEDTYDWQPKACAVEYVEGDSGQSACPSGYELLNDMDECLKTGTGSASSAVGATSGLGGSVSVWCAEGCFHGTDSKTVFYNTMVSPGASCQAAYRPVCKQVYERYSVMCWNAYPGSDMAARDASCAGDLVCARSGWDGRDFGDCLNSHCCSEVPSTTALVCSTFTTSLTCPSNGCTWTGSACTTDQYILGSGGQTDCPYGYSLLTDMSQCLTSATASVVGATSGVGESGTWWCAVGCFMGEDTNKVYFNTATTDSGGVCNSDYRPVCKQLYQRYSPSCWTAGYDTASRDASCRGDLICARFGYDDRYFGDCYERHCCTQAYQAEMLSSLIPEGEGEGEGASMSTELCCNPQNDRVEMGCDVSAETIKNCCAPVFAEYAKRGHLPTVCNITTIPILWRASSTYYIGDGVGMPGLQRYFSVDSSSFQEHNLGSTATYYFGPDGTDKGVATVTAFQGGVDIIFRDHKSDLVGKRFYQSAGIMEPAGKPSRFADFDQTFTGASFYEQIGVAPIQTIYTNIITASQGSSVSEIILFTGNQKPFSGYSVKSVIGSSEPGIFYDKYFETLMKPDTTIPPAKVWGIVAADKYCEGSFRRRYPYQGKSRAIPSNSGITKSLGIYKNVSECQKTADADAECGDTIWSNDANCDCVRAGETCTMVDSIMQNSVYQKNPPSLAPLFDYAKEKSCLFAVPAYSWQVKFGGLCNDYLWRGMGTMDALPDEDKCPELCIMGLEYIDDLCAKEDVIGGMNRTAIFDAELNTGLYPTCETPVSQVTETTWEPGPSEAVIVDYSKKYREELLLRFAALPGVSKTCKLFFQEQVVFSIIDTDNNKKLDPDESIKAGITTDEYTCMDKKDYNKATGSIPSEIFTYFKPVPTLQVADALGMPPRLLADDREAKHDESPLARRLSDDKCGVHSWASIFGNYSGDLNYIAREKQMYGWVTNTTETCNSDTLCGAVPAITRTVRCKRLAVANCDLQKIFGTSKGYGAWERKGAGYSHPTAACTYTDLGEEAQQVVDDAICAVFSPKPSSSVPCPSIPEGDACYPAADQKLSGYTCQEACDWQCYLNRYPDLAVLGALNTAAAENHYSTSGKSEGRDCTCSDEPLTCQENLVTVAAKFNAQVAAVTRDAICHSEDAMGTIAEFVKKTTSASRAIVKCVSEDANDASHGAAGDTDSRRLQTTFIIQIVLYLKPAEATQTKLGEKEAALDQTSVPITIEGVEQDFSIKTVVPPSFVNFQLSKEPYACPTIPCANQCGEPAVSGPDGYTCVVAGVFISARTCEELHPAIFASKPMTTTVCCPTPDPEYCEPAYQAPTPEPTASPTALDCFGTWMMWGSCSSTCEWGIRSRRYRIITHQEFGGKPCEPKEYKEDCWASTCPVNCEGKWGPWSQCEASCGPGKKFRQYMVSTLGKHGGRKCPENPQMMECNLGVCPFRKPRAEPSMVAPVLADNNDVAMALSGAACDPVSSCASEISNYACPISCATTYVAEDYIMDKDQIAFSYYGYGCAGEGDCSDKVFKFLCPQKCAKLEVIAGDKEMAKEKRMQDKAESRAATKKAKKELRTDQKAKAKEILEMGEKAPPRLLAEQDDRRKQAAGFQFV